MEQGSGLWCIDGKFHTGSKLSNGRLELYAQNKTCRYNFIQRASRGDQTSISMFLLSIYSTAQACPPAKNYMSPCLLTKNPVESRHPASASTERGF